LLKRKGDQQPERKIRAEGKRRLPRHRPHCELHDSSRGERSQRGYQELHRNAGEADPDAGRGEQLDVANAEPLKFPER
jgi:hypothetical protein